MCKHFLSFFCISLTIFSSSSYGQDDFIRSKEGRIMLSRKQIMKSCLSALKKDRFDKTGLIICECQMDLIDGRFTNKQYKKHTISGLIKIDELINEDSLLSAQIRDCYTNTGQSTLLFAEASEDRYISSCMKRLSENSEKKLDSVKLHAFCRCQSSLVKSKKITDSEMATLSDPNSMLFFEMIYKCGDPFNTNSVVTKNWDKQSSSNLTGPDSDTVNVLNLDGLTYLKIKIGSEMKVWLFDTGASDLLITAEMEKKLLGEQIFNSENYLGIGEYEMANGMIDSCRKYSVNGIQMGKFIIDHVTVAVTEKGKRIIAGRSLLNKFRTWIINNQEKTLILSR